MTAPTLTYTTLLSDVLAYSERTDQVVIDQITRCVMYGENRIASEKKPLGFQRVVTGVFAGNTLAKPARWRLTRSFSYLTAANKRVYLKNRSYEFCRSYWPVASVTAPPLYYSDYAYDNFFFAGTPDAAYTFELSYFEKPEPLSSTNQTNWNTEYAPQVLLYASLVELMRFLKNDERVAVFDQAYAQALDAITKEDAERLIDSSVARSK